jgi:hypothetical protein
MLLVSGFQLLEKCAIFVDVRHLDVFYVVVVLHVFDPEDDEVGLG